MCMNDWNLFCEPSFCLILSLLFQKHEFRSRSRHPEKLVEEEKNSERDESKGFLLKAARRSNSHPNKDKNRRHD